MSQVLEVTSNEQVFQILKDHDIDPRTFMQESFELKMIFIDQHGGLVLQGIVNNRWTSSRAIERNHFHIDSSPYMMNWSDHEYETWLTETKVVPMQWSALREIVNVMTEAIEAEVSNAESGDSGNYDPYDQQWFKGLINERNKLAEKIGYELASNRSI